MSGVLEHDKTVLHLAAEKQYDSAMQLACWPASDQVLFFPFLTRIVEDTDAPRRE